MFKSVVSRLVGWEPHGRLAWLIAIRVVWFRLLIAASMAMSWNSDLGWFTKAVLTLILILFWSAERRGHLQQLERIQ